jgi:hypothetical protein
MIFRLSSIDKNDESRFCMRFSLFPCFASSLLCSGAWCRPPYVCDTLMHSSRNILLATLADSCCLLISLSTRSSRLFYWCRMYWYHIKTSLVKYSGITVPWFASALIICHSIVERQTFSLAAMIRLKRIYNF